MERMFFLVNRALYVSGYLYLRRYYDEFVTFVVSGCQRLFIYT